MVGDPVLRRALLDLAETLERGGVDAFVVGALAVALHGAPRPTRAIDVVADVPPGRSAPVVALFARSPFAADAAALAEAIPRRRTFSVKHRATSVAAIVIPRKMGFFDDGRFARALDVEVEPGRAVHVASPEDVILKKLEALRFEGDPKHAADVRSLLRTVGGTLDHAYLESWLDGLGVREAWESCLRAT
jgi:hypothetical protein